MTLDGHTVVVIGGSSGMGLATARAAALDGARVTIASSRQERVDAALGELPDGCEGMALDVRDEAQVAAVLERIGELDHLAFTAGDAFAPRPLAGLDLDAAHATLDVRFWGAVTVAKHAAPRIRPGGSIGLTTGTVGQPARTLRQHRSVSRHGDEGALAGDVVGASVASYSHDPASFAAHGADAVAGPFARFAALLPANALVLDAGCGSGRDLARLRALGHRGIGVDLNEDFARLAGREAPTTRGDLRCLPVRSGSVDAVWASASLIHLPSDDAGVALGELARVAKVGASLGISVRTGGVTGWADDPPLGRRWFYHWAPGELTGSIEHLGLSVEAVSAEGGWIELIARR